MERRTDQGPDLNQMIALSQGLGRAGYGGGFGGGGYGGFAMGNPIGISRQAYQNAYMGGLAQHLSMTANSRRGYGGTQRARQRGKINRQTGGGFR